MSQSLTIPELEKCILELQTQLAKARETETELRAARDRFLAGLSHELRTPMMAILGFVTLLEDEKITPDIRRMYTQTIYLNAQHLLAMLNDALDLSKINAGDLAIETVPSNLIDVMSDVCMLMGPKARRKGLQFTARLCTPFPEKLNLDPTRFRQILLSIVGNAIKFTQGGSVSFEASFIPGEGVNPGTIQVEVRDTGIGMSPEQAEKLQHQLDSGTPAAKRVAGLGLGLTVATRLASILGGSITFKTSPGEGSSFFITMAAHDPSGRRIQPIIPTEPSHRAIRPKGEALNAHVLVAEDSPDNQRLISLHLRRAGCEVVVASNGLDAIHVYQTYKRNHKPFDFVLMDLNMPELDGYEATRRLRSLGATEPILAFTAQALASDRQRCLDAGCDDYATKPMEAASLLDYCRKWIGARSERHAA